ncbi:ABC transporter transmembrane region family protein [Asticcacaulis biprosthecium C19]|uniref:ABC transporter transmembrane region family protein n=1 Tax=Asticcacaulis biprosthecium C19 TaxID=715226 RepID=F4QP96_9CAUL|nr:ABC transporter transmembrane region family protein [Asticcacaulis biprosthecium C19]
MADSSPQIENTDRPGAGAELIGDMRATAARRAKTRDLRPLMRLGPYLWRQRVNGLFMLLFLAISSATLPVMTFIARELIDKGFGSGQVAELNKWFVVLGAVALVMALATALRYFFITRMGERIVADLREDVFGHILKLDPGFFLKMRTGEVISRLTADIQIIETLVAASISIALRNLLSFVIGLALMMVVSPKLTLMVMGLFPFILVPLITFGRHVGKVTRETQDMFARAVGFAGESLDALETVQAFVRERFTQNRFNEGVEAAYTKSVSRIVTRATMTAMVISLVFGGTSVVLWLGAQDVLHGRMSNGVLIQFVMLAIFTAGSVANLNETWADVQKAAGAMLRIDELLRSEPNIQAPKDAVALPVPARGEILFDSVNFAYPSRPETPVLDGFSLHIKPGETVALVGPSGRVSRPCSSCCCATTSSRPARSPWTVSISAAPTPRRCANAWRWWLRIRRCFRVRRPTIFALAAKAPATTTSAPPRRKPRPSALSRPCRKVSIIRWANAPARCRVARNSA